LLALAIAIVAGYLWLRLLPIVSDKQFWQVLTFAAVLLVYAFTHAVGGTALFAVMAFGAALANLPDPRHSADSFVFRILPPDPSRAIHSFHAELAFLVRSFLRTARRARGFQRLAERVSGLARNHSRAVRRSIDRSAAQPSGLARDVVSRARNRYLADTTWVNYRGPRSGGCPRHEATT
jgi:hypothetical protein